MPVMVFTTRGTRVRDVGDICEDMSTFSALDQFNFLCLLYMRRITIGCQYVIVA